MTKNYTKNTKLFPSQTLDERNIAYAFAGIGIVESGTEDADVLSGTTDDDILSGLGGNDILFGLGGNDILDGGDGRDFLDGGSGNDTMTGGIGSDTYIVDASTDVINENPLSGNDKVQASASFTLVANVEDLTLTGSEDIDATGNGSANILRGNTGNNILLGNGGKDTLYGDEGDDSLNGGSGNDLLYGGTGNDKYIVDAVGDEVIEEESGELGGIDKVESSVSFTLPDNLEKLTLTGSAAIDATGNDLGNFILGNIAGNVLIGNDGNDKIYGDGGNDTLYGGDGDDLLEGDSGNDTHIGGLGNDRYIVDASTDVIIEDDFSGTDRVQASDSFTLPANVENLALTGTGAINGTGNELDNELRGNGADNVLTGNDGNDRLLGFGGDDTLYGGNNDDTLEAGSGEDRLYGGDGDDLLNGGSGIDLLDGGIGNDNYIVDDSDDEVIEGLLSGFDSVVASASFTLPSNVENLTLKGVAIDAIGNELPNELQGNGVSNVILGYDGNDTLNGGGGDDLLDGGTDIDTFIGGKGNDIFIVDNSNELITEDLSAGTDSVQASKSFTLAANIENMTLTGSASIDATGNELDNVLRGNVANNVILGNDGIDRLYGESGNDVLDGGTDNDTLTGGDGQDVFRFTSDITLNVDTITDFVVADDTLELDNAIFSNLTFGVVNKAFFTIGTKANDWNDFLIYNQSNGNLMYDADGNDSGVAVKIAVLGSGLSLTNEDFVVI